MNFIATSTIRRHTWRLILSVAALCVLACTQAALAGISLTITKTNNAPTPVPSGQIFTYTIAYSWSGGPGTLIITDAVPAALDVISAAPGGPISTIVGNNVTFTLTTTSSSGAGTVQINARFKPGVTCPGTRACNIAYINVPGGQPIPSNTDCVTATASNKWQFWKDYISGCELDTGDVIYRINLVNPSGNDIGGLDLLNISLQDILPPGAILTGVTPFPGTVPPSWSGPGTGTGTITLTGGPTNLTVQPGWAWWGCYIHVKYPSGTFAVGQTVTNNATLRFQTPCSDGQFLTMSGSAHNTLCDHPAIGGWMSKWLNLWMYFPANPWYTPTWSPGCCGTYSVYYNNSGAVPQSSVIIDDNLPPTVDVGNVTTYVPAGITSVIMDVFCYVAGVCQAVPATSLTYTTSGTYSPTGLPGPICRIRWKYTGTVNPGGYLYNSIDVCLRTNSYIAPFPAVVAGQNCINTACVSGTNVPPGLCGTTNNVVTPTAPNIRTAKFFEGKSGSCMPGCAPSTAGPYYPGDVLRFRMVVANVGSATATPCTITDVLPSGFTYVGNPTYYYGPIVWATSNNPPCCSLTAAPPAVIGGLTSPSVGATTLTWNFATLPAQCSGSVDYLVIEFDVKASDVPTIPPGNYFNTFTFSAGNLGTPVTSNPAEVTINGYAQVQISKDVRPNITGTTFSSSAGIQPGGQAEFRLRIKNTGILTLSNIYLLDILPHVGDITVLPLPTYNFRGSAFDMPLSAAVTAVPGYTYGYNNSANTKNPKRSTLFCTTLDPTTGVPPLTTGTFVPAYLSTFSFQISGGAGTWIAPGGTQDFFFLSTVPAGAAIGSTACNSYGLQVTPYGTTTCLRAEATPACVTVIPPDKHECDSIWGDVQIDPCCSFTIPILNTLGSISELHYNVLPVGGGVSPSGVVQSVVTSPCVPSSTIPVSLAGTTSGSLFYTPPCGSPLNAQFHLAASTPSGEVCIELTATIVRADGTMIECTDTICIHCDPAVKDRCDSMDVKPFPSKNLSMRTFTIHNLKSPGSPICSVKISVVPPPGGSGLHGSGLVVDGTPQAWPAGSSMGYTQITTAHGLPAATSVQFTLGVDFGIGWVGTVTVTVYHCDQDSCTMDYGPWDAGKGPVIVIGTPTDIDRATLHMHALTFPHDAAIDKHVRSIAVHYNDPVTELVAVTGATYPCDGDAQANCNDILEGVHVSDRSLMIDLRRDLDDQRNTSDPTVTVVYRANGQNNPTVEIIYYDESGQEVGHDEVAVTGDDPPGQAISGLNGGNRMAMVMGALTAVPNPTSGRCDLGFTLPSASTVDLELLDARGTVVAKVITGEHLFAGEYHRAVDMKSLASGTYLVSLRVNGVPSVLRVELTK